MEEKPFRFRGCAIQSCKNPSKEPGLQLQPISVFHVAKYVNFGRICDFERTHSRRRLCFYIYRTFEVAPLLVSCLPCRLLTQHILRPGNFSTHMPILLSRFAILSLGPPLTAKLTARSAHSDVSINVGRVQAYPIGIGVEGPGCTPPKGVNCDLNVEKRAVGVLIMNSQMQLHFYSVRDSLASSLCQGLIFPIFRTN